MLRSKKLNYTYTLNQTRLVSPLLMCFFVRVHVRVGGRVSHFSICLHADPAGVGELVMLKLYVYLAYTFISS
jgi:hypothetical protein